MIINYDVRGNTKSRKYANASTVLIAWLFSRSVWIRVDYIANVPNRDKEKRVKHLKGEKCWDVGWFVLYRLIRNAMVPLACKLRLASFSVVFMCSFRSSTGDSDGNGRKHRNNSNKHHRSPDSVHWPKYISKIIRWSHRSCDYLTYDTPLNPLNPLSSVYQYRL